MAVIKHECPLKCMLSKVPVRGMYCFNQSVERIKKDEPKSY